ncbi:hypothetical protein [Haloplanus salinarum]|uniref:hypothetical protein n=1 Tax=Haloplanus salinarum TaxID=1912324 RepID=UPI00214AC438|nr:hypothetical protein [Haloplanus salinarum]
MQSETNAGEKARARLDEPNTETPSDDRCFECGDLLVVRTGDGHRCVECLLDHLAVGDRGGRR